MKKILFISNTANFSKFNHPFMRWFRSQGWLVDYCSAGEEFVQDCDNQFSISVTRNPFSIKNIKAYIQFKKILSRGYDIIHCHTPMGGFIARWGARKQWKQGKVKIIYTAHGFHFYKGAPIINWLLYYPVEKMLARYTDILITINQEDYHHAKLKLKNCKQIYKTDGVGVDLSRFHKLDFSEKKAFRGLLGYSDSDFIISIIAEINKNKNQIMLIKQMSRLKEEMTNLKILLIGKENIKDVRKLVNKLGFENIVNFLGYRTDVERFLGISDIAFSASLREGLGINIVEAMASGIPVVCSINRGHVSLIEDKKTGLLFGIGNSTEMIDCILQIYNNKKYGEMLSENAMLQVQKYSLDNAMISMTKIYQSIMVGIKEDHA